MSKNFVIVGINCAHDASACLVIGGKIVLAISEERLTRIKHHRGFPTKAIKSCVAFLEENNYCKRIDYIVVNQMPSSDYHIEIEQVFKDFEILKIIINPSHHLLHALYAYASSNYDEAVVLVVDGSGYTYGEYKRRGSKYLGNPPLYDDSWEALSCYFINNEKIEVLSKDWGVWTELSEKRLRFPSLGHMYSLAAQHIFGSWTHAGKVMGLAPYGDPAFFNFDIVNVHNGKLQIDTEWILKIPPITNTQNYELDPIAPHISAKIQSELEKAFIFLIDNLQKMKVCKNICLTGGVALNTVCNGKIVQANIFENVYVAPVAHDSGVALGAAAYGYFIHQNSLPKWHNSQEFLGLEYSDESIIKALKKTTFLSWERIANPELQAAQDISEGKIIGWFEGRSEFGPRALGHRSILADARRKETPDLLNKKVKYRESFRPFAASILEEFSEDFFETYNNISNPWMMFVYKVKSKTKVITPGIVHVDGTCRIQTVSKEYPGRYRNLIENFYKITGVPLIVNTSLNVRGEPMCETPDDAIDTFIKTGIEVLYLSNFRITKTILDGIWENDMNKIPTIHDNYGVVQYFDIKNEKLSSSNCFLYNKKNRMKIDLSDIGANLVRLINGKNSINEIIKSLSPTYSEQAISSNIYNWYYNGILYIK